MNARRTAWRSVEQCCPTCGGQGWTDRNTRCASCEGTGGVYRSPLGDWTTCQSCEGSGEHDDSSECAACNGEGVVIACTHCGGSGKNRELDPAGQPVEGDCCHCEGTGVKDEKVREAIQLALYGDKYSWAVEVAA